MGKKRRPSSKSPSFSSWIEQYDTVSNWLDRYDLPALLAANKGLVKLSNFLPLPVANGALEVLQGIPDSEWNMTLAAEDYEHNNIEHKFQSSKSPCHLGSLLRVFTLLLPDSLSTFSAGKYTQGDHIASHDDRAYTDVLMVNGQVVTCSRSIAVIYYLTHDWVEEDGGVLVDLETGTSYVPEFNSLIAFTIPRFHQVTAVNTERPRYSVFGWFLTPGLLYDLMTGKADAAQEQQQQQEEEEAGKGEGGGPPQQVAVGQSPQQPAQSQQEKVHKQRPHGSGKRRKKQEAG